MDRQTCTIRVSLPTKLSYMLLHLHTRHTTLVILLTIVKEEGGICTEESLRPKPVSPVPVSRREGPRGENIEAAGMEGEGACEPIRTFTTSARRVCSSKEGTIGSHLPSSPQEEHLRASNARACRAPLAPPASCHSRPAHITDLSRLRRILRIFCASKEHFCNYI